MLMVLLGLLVFCTGWYCYEFYQCSRYTPVGDPLFDRYARAIIRREAPKLWFTNVLEYYSYQDHHLLDSQLAQWEPDFGDDPRYWQLRYWNAQEQADSSLLLTAYERGVKDAMLILLLARPCEDAGFAEVSALSQASFHPETPEGQARIAKVRQATGAEVEPLYAEAIELAPGQAWPYYERALSRLAREDYAGAEADFRAGNAAPHNDAFEIYPETVLREQLLADPFGSNATLYGMLRSPFCDPYSYNWSVLCDKQHKLCGFIEQQPTSTFNAEFHRFLCRVAQEQGEPYMALSCLRASQKMAEQVLLDPSLTPEQQAVLLYARTLTQDSMRFAWIQLDIARTTSPSVIPGFGFYLGMASGSSSVNPRDKATLSNIVSIYFPRNYYFDSAWIERIYIQTTNDHLSQAAKQLEELDYTTLSLPAAWRESNLEPASDNSHP